MKNMKKITCMMYVIMVVGAIVISGSQMFGADEKQPLMLYSLIQVDGKLVSESSDIAKNFSIKLLNGVPSSGAKNDHSPFHFIGGVNENSNFVISYDDGKGNKDTAQPRTSSLGAEIKQYYDLGPNQKMESTWTFKFDTKPVYLVEAKAMFGYFSNEPSVVLILNITEAEKKQKDSL